MAVFSPLPPARTAIATYNAELLPELARHVEVTAFVRDASVDGVVPVEGVTVTGIDRFDPADFDLAVYHVGNNGEFHADIQATMIRHPGLAVVHDLRLTEFVNWSSVHRPDIVDLIIPRGPSAVGVDLASLESVVSRSRAILVHGGESVCRVRRTYPSAQVFCSHLALPRPSPPPSIFDVSSLGWGTDDFILGALGGIGPHKRIERVLPVVAGIRCDGVPARLIVAGWTFDPGYLAALRSLVDEHGIADSVAFHVDLSEDDMAAVLVACDATIDLRDDLTGSASMSLMTTLAHRLPAIVPDLPEFADIDDLLVHRVAVSQPAMSVDCGLHIARLAHGKRSRQDSAITPPDRRLLLENVAQDHLGAILAAIDLPDPPHQSLTLAEGRAMTRDLGNVTVVGQFRSTTGLMEFGRSISNVLHRAGVRLQHLEITPGGALTDANRDVGRLADALPRERSADVELWLLNINEFTSVPESMLRPAGTRRRVIGVWFWELPVLDEPYLSQIDRVDEIWVGSPWVQRMFRQHTSKPVVLVPMPVSTMPLASLDRSSFGLDDDDLVFMFDFDANSHPARKNPLGVVDAFARAFADVETDPDGRRPRLVVKGGNLDSPRHAGFTNELRTNLGSVGGVLVDEELDRRGLDSLMALSDVYVSLHRAEGLGIGMLEAMHLGKPVVSPAYPHKWIFPASTVSCSVASPPRRIDGDDVARFGYPGPVYVAGHLWTEPDVTDAAFHLRRLFDSPGLRAALGARAARAVREHYNVANALTVMTSRLAPTRGSSDDVLPRAVDRAPVRGGG